VKYAVYRDAWEPFYNLDPADDDSDLVIQLTDEEFEDWSATVGRMEIWHHRIQGKLKESNQGS